MRFVGQAPPTAYSHGCVRRVVATFEILSIYRSEKRIWNQCEYVICKRMENVRRDKTFVWQKINTEQISRRKYPIHRKRKRRRIMFRTNYQKWKASRFETRLNWIVVSTKLRQYKFSIVIGHADQRDGGKKRQKGRTTRERKRERIPPILYRFTHAPGTLFTWP